MIRLFLPPESLSSPDIIIRDENARYLATVLRTTPGESLTVFDGVGNRYLCRVLRVHKKEVILKRIERQRYSTESPLHLILAQAIPKGEKMELIIQKATELGIKKLIPLITERSQVRDTRKVARWRKIAISASQQSGREVIPVIEEPVGFDVFIRQRGIETGVVFFEGDSCKSLRDVLSMIKDKKSVLLLVGPEGGFSNEEIEKAIQNGFIKASLGPRILRTETASITAISIIQYEMGDMG